VLLAPEDLTPVSVYNEGSSSPLLIVADHAGNSIPHCLARLGLEDSEIERHIGWDIGIAGVCRELADALDATLVLQNYSRLVIDCNRPPGSETSIPEIAELIPVPGNIGLSDAQKESRIHEIFQPYHDRIEAELNRRKSDQPRALIAMHSFTPAFMGVSRSWHAGVLYNRDARFARLVMALLKLEDNLVIGENEPYDVSDSSDYTIPVHGERRGLPHVGIEVRQDLISNGKGQREWASLFARVLSCAYQQAISAKVCL
jgi:predicted N-formylglutamate amidohydrolase